MIDWKPIETAPKETDVLLWFDEDTPLAVAGLFYGEWKDMHSHNYYFPQYWAELPEGPKVDE